MAIGAFLPIILWATADNFVKAYLTGAGILIAFGLADDFKVLSYKMKFLGQFCAALVIIIYGGVRITDLGYLLPDDMVLMNWFSVGFTLIVIVGVTNAINFADGLDGLAGGISLLGFCCIAYFAHLVESKEVFLISLSLAGATFGFLRFNTHPASVFMGDTGSQLLGFTAIVLAVKITQEHTALSPVLPLIILGFPILDTLTIMADRIVQGRFLFGSDKNHFHHRLIRLGFYHTEAVFMIYLIQSVMIISAIIFRFHFAWLLMVGYTIFSVAVVSVFTVADRTGFQVPRYHLIDRIIKGKLKMIKDDNLAIRISFEILKLLLPIILLFSCLLPSRIPGYASLTALFFSVLLIAVWMFWKSFMAFILRFILFLTIPLALYIGEAGTLGWISPKMLTGYHLSF
ncbi:MAG: MraY family glycosyltransferase, partial [Planctomycetota bacterium]